MIEDNLYDRNLKFYKANFLKKLISEYSETNINEEDIDLFLDKFKLRFEKIMSLQMCDINVVYAPTQYVNLK